MLGVEVDLVYVVDGVVVQGACLDDLVAFAQYLREPGDDVVPGALADGEHTDLLHGLRTVSTPYMIC